MFDVYFDFRPKIGCLTYISSFQLLSKFWTPKGFVTKKYIFLPKSIFSQKISIVYKKIEL